MFYTQTMHRACENARYHLLQQLLSTQQLLEKERMRQSFQHHVLWLCFLKSSRCSNLEILRRHHRCRRVLLRRSGVLQRRRGLKALHAHVGRCLCHGRRFLLVHRQLLRLLLVQMGIRVGVDVDTGLHVLGLQRQLAANEGPHDQNRAGILQPEAVDCKVACNLVTLQ